LNLKARFRYEERNKNGICQRCLSKAAPGLVLCEKHLMLGRARRKISPDTPKVKHNERREGDHETNFENA